MAKSSFMLYVVKKFVADGIKPLDLASSRNANLELLPHLPPMAQQIDEIDSQLTDQRRHVRLRRDDDVLLHSSSMFRTNSQDTS